MTLPSSPHSKTLLRDMFSKRGIRPKRWLGQNFLIDHNVLQFIVNSAGIRPDDVILEVGTGTGALTALLAEKAQMVFSVEMDAGLFRLAGEVLKPYRNVRLINKDILRSKTALEPQVTGELSAFSAGKESALKVVANLPYSISTPLIIKLLEGPLPIELMVLTLQSDIVNRLAALPGTKDYGILSILTQLASEIEVLKTLSPEVFWPVPRVESSVVLFRPHRERSLKSISSNYALFEKIVRTVFESRRKIILNSFARFRPPLITKERLVVILKGLGISPEQRGETLTPEQFVHLSEEINGFLKQDNGVNPFNKP